MIKWLALLATFGLAHLAATVAVAGASESADDNNWLMLVMTENTDPARDTEFNDWYNRVDIPDVLQVPGFVRARRGQEQKTTEFATTNSPKNPLKYAAFYDIESHDIDKTIIDMLMASWGMEKSHHSTDLLKVTERVYFQQYGSLYESSVPKPPKANTYLYVTGFDCCHNAIAAKRFNRWYNGRYVPAVLASSGTISVARYKLYRVLMEKPVKVPEFMTVSEIEADSAERALQDMDQVLHELSDADRDNRPYVEGSHSVFLMLKDVKRQ